jgi:hypothetical protein
LPTLAPCSKAKRTLIDVVRAAEIAAAGAVSQIVALSQRMHAVQFTHAPALSHSTVKTSVGRAHGYATNASIIVWFTSVGFSTGVTSETESEGRGLTLFEEAIGQSISIQRHPVFCNKATRSICGRTRNVIEISLHLKHLLGTICAVQLVEHESHSLHVASASC